MHVYIGLTHTLVYGHEYDYECGHSIILCICVSVLGVVDVHGLDELGVCGNNPPKHSPSNTHTTIRITHTTSSAEWGVVAMCGLVVSVCGCVCG